MQKLVLLGIGFLCSASAFAMGPGNSWKEIWSDKNIRYSTSYDLGGIRLNNACVTDSEVRSILPEHRCRVEGSADAGRSSDNGSRNVFHDCIAYEDVSLAIPRAYQAEGCVAWRQDIDPDAGPHAVCVERGMIVKTIPDTIEVSVYVDDGADGGNNSFPNAFTKVITLPACAY